MMNSTNLFEKYKKIPVPVRASIWFVICSILQRGISFITVPIFTRIMTTEQYGIYSTYLSWYNLLIVFTSLNLYYGVFNNAMLKYENQRDKYISSMQGLITVITGAFFIFYLIFQRSINNFMGMSTLMILLMFLELLFSPALQFWMVYNRFEFKYKQVVIVTILKSILNPLLGILFVLLSEQKEIARIASMVLVEVIFCGIIAVIQFCKGRCFFNFEYWKFAFIFNVPLLPHYLSGSILNQGDRIMISKMVGDSQVAYYSVANNLGQIMNIFNSAIAASFTPWVYKELRKKEITEIPRVTNMLLLIMGIFVILLTFWAPEIMLFLASPEYKEAIYVIPPIAASVFFMLMYNLLANIEFFYEEKKYVTIGSISAAIINLILNYFFIIKFGYYAAGYTTLFCYIIYGLSHLYFSKYVIKKHMGVYSIFDERTIIILSLCIVIITIIQNFLYSFTLLRYVLIGTIMIGILFKRKKIITELKNIGVLK